MQTQQNFNKLDWAQHAFLYLLSSNTRRGRPSRHVFIICSLTNPPITSTTAYWCVVLCEPILLLYRRKDTYRSRCEFSTLPFRDGNFLKGLKLPSLRFLRFPKKRVLSSLTHLEHIDPSSTPIRDWYLLRMQCLVKTPLVSSFRFPGSCPLTRSDLTSWTRLCGLLAGNSCYFLTN